MDSKFQNILFSEVSVRAVVILMDVIVVVGFVLMAALLVNAVLRTLHNILNTLKTATLSFVLLMPLVAIMWKTGSISGVYHLTCQTLKTEFAWGPTVLTDFVNWAC